MRTLLWRFLPFAVVITGICGLIALEVQQNYRLSANEPQIGLANTAAQLLFTGTSPASIASPQNIDVGKMEAPFLIIYDEGRKPTASTGTLRGEIPTPPQGLFDAALKDGEYRETWQPYPDIRFAAVMVHVQGGSGGYVLAARSLKETERLESLGQLYAVLAWAVIMLATLLALFLELRAGSRGSKELKGF